MLRKLYLIALVLSLTITPGHAMHIMEGYLPLGWCIFWYLVSLPFVVLSYRAISRDLKASPKGRITLALNTAFVFILSALKLPSVTGSSSHLTGTTLGTLTSGPMSMPLIGVIVLLFQALLLAHGGISTLGANVFSLAIAGPLVAYAIYTLCRRLGLGKSMGIFLAAFIGSMATYVTTSLQLAVVFPDAQGGIWASFAKFMSIFAITQVPLSLLEGLMTLGVIRLMERTDSTATSRITSSSKPAFGMRQFLLTLGALVCLAAPILSAYIDFGEGSDDRAGAMVESLAPDYLPTPFFEGYEPSETLEPWLFVLQVVVGIALFVWAYRLFSKRQTK
ncbi:MAG: energy-coupling factor ABC transporter permease [Porphyromonadaceae bacterium]|nr:energy-coupling factor ABC transporter permease [Porphyromonadaceae bacterium]